MTFDVVATHMSDEMMRCISVWTLSISAILTFILAFAVTSQASFRCWLAALRWVQRFFLCAMAITMAYGAAYIADHAYTPPGPFVIMFVVTMVVIIISGIRHLSAPALSADNTWSGGWFVIRENVRRLLLPPDRHHTIRTR